MAMMPQSLQLMCIQVSVNLRSTVKCLISFSQVPWIGLWSSGHQGLAHSRYWHLKVPKNMCMMPNGVPHIQVSLLPAMLKDLLTFGTLTKMLRRQLYGNRCKISQDLSTASDGAKMAVGWQLVTLTAMSPCWVSIKSLQFLNKTTLTRYWT